MLIKNLVKLSLMIIVSLDLEELFREIKIKNLQNIRFNRFSQTYLGLSAFKLTDYKKVLSLDTDILCQGDFKILISNQVEGDFIAVSDSQRPLKVIEYFRKQNKTKSFISIESTKKPYQVNTGVYVLHEKLISMEEAIRRLTGFPADNLGIKNRGYLKPIFF